MTRLLVFLLVTVAGCGGLESAHSPTATSPISAAPEATAAEPGDLQPEPSTFHSLAVRWPVRGDANANALIEVRYRLLGDAQWRVGLPLFRTSPDAVSPANRVPDGWLFAGSIVDLTADTEYEVKLSLRDPDGGDVDRTIVLRTLAEPREPAPMRVRHVVPETPGSAGAASAPGAFRGLVAAQTAAEPGDLFLLHAGVYAVGTWTIDRHGRPGRPIIYRSAGDGEVIIDGGGAQRLISANGIQHVWFEGLTLRNAQYLFVGHEGGNTVIRHCRFEVVRIGIEAINGGYERSRGFVITDNVFSGPTTWPRRKGIEGINGITITGAGHVVSYNRLTNLGDAVHGTGHGGLSASDIHNNDIEICTDDGIEADYADTNVRVFRNRITNCVTAISGQPIRGGPLYVFRNAIYNLQYSPFKLHNDTAGILIFHNTSVMAGIPWHIDPAGETVRDVVTRNNILIGTIGPALRSTGRMIRCDFDSDGYAWFSGPPSLQLLLGDVFALWNNRTFASPAAAQRSGLLYRTHGATTLGASHNFANELATPSDFRIRYPVASNDLRLASGSRAVDAGVVVPNFSDGFAGKAPDLGCCELGASPPDYGPRPVSSR